MLPNTLWHALIPHLVTDSVDQQLLCGDALLGLADGHACQAVLQVEALAEHLQGWAAVAAQRGAVLGAAQQDRRDGQVVVTGIVQLNDSGLKMRSGGQQ
jgi:hypothetical protein